MSLKPQVLKYATPLNNSNTKILNINGWLSKIVVHNAEGSTFHINGLEICKITSNFHVIDFREWLLTIHKKEKENYLNSFQGGLINDLTSVEILFILINNCERFSNINFPDNPIDQRWLALNFDRVDEASLRNITTNLEKVSICEYPF